MRSFWGLFMPRRLPRILDASSRRTKQWLMVGWDTASAALALLGAVALRLGIATPWESVPWWQVVAFAGLVPVAFQLLGLYREITRYVGPRVAFTIGQGTIIACIAMAMLLFVSPDRGLGFPRTAVPIAGLMVLLSSGGIRLLVRHLLRATVVGKRRVAIYGAGDAGAGLMIAMAQDAATQVVAFFDDSISRSGGAIRGVPILDTERLAERLVTMKIEAFLVALSPAARRKQHAILEQVNLMGVPVLVVPTLAEIHGGQVRVDQLRPVALEDLLGREPVTPDRALLGADVVGKVVMVTGGGGSIGSELCRQIAALGPKSLIVIDHGEFNLFEVDSELSRLLAQGAPGASRVALHRHLASVTDAVRMDQLIAQHLPDTIYHAAAYKHVPIVEDNESEGAEVNVLGTLRVAEAAIRHGVAKVVLVSTDKAVRPTSVMGATKRMSELVLQGLQAELDAAGALGERADITDRADQSRAASSQSAAVGANGSPIAELLEQRAQRWRARAQGINADHRSGRPRRTVFTMVRFGNVLGSSGSVVPIFREQIARGGPVTVTHPEVTRYFMTIPEAVQLILQAGAMAHGGEVFVLDMGEPVKIADMACNMIRLAGRSVRDAEHPTGDIQIQFTGLRPGEKLYEELIIGDDVDRTTHPAIMTAREGFVPWAEFEATLQRLEAAVSQHDAPAVRAIVDRTAGVKRSQQGPSTMSARS
ncbi:MAG: polysaccharide biosynthesis protein [Phycisphaerae bacterium]|nr:polysaccharide biosynthesis protein [Phycisphaerae bacterium]